MDAEQRPDPAQALGGRFRMVAELLRHPADAATGTELLHGGADRLRHDVGARRIRPLQAGGEQRMAQCVVLSQAGWPAAGRRVRRWRRPAPGWRPRACARCW